MGVAGALQQPKPVTAGPLILEQFLEFSYSSHPIVLPNISPWTTRGLMPGVDPWGKPMRCALSGNAYIRRVAPWCYTDVGCMFWLSHSPAFHSLKMCCWLKGNSKMALKLETGFAQSPACIAGIPVCFREETFRSWTGARKASEVERGGWGNRSDQTSPSIFLAPVSLLNESCLK